MMKRRHIDMKRKSVYLLPNICTTANLFLGFYSIIMSLNGKFTSAAWALILAGVFDLFDGRIARLTKAQSAFGIEFDSLVDLVSFGVGPTVLLYIWTLNGLGKVGWFAAFLYLACGTMRLARYNVQHHNEETFHFQGLPIPTAATIIVTGVLCHFKYFPNTPPRPELIAGITILLSLLMISTIKYRSLKSWDFRQKLSLFALVLVSVAVFIIAVKPAMAIFVIMSTYVVSGLLEATWNILRRRPRRRLEKRAEKTVKDEALKIEA